VTIEKGVQWGQEVDRPAGLRVVDDDAALAAALDRADPGPVAVGRGDLARTINAAPIADRSRLMALPIDLLEVSLDGGDPLTACAHVLVHRQWWRGGWLRGRVLVALNAEYLGGRDLAPRGHPDDGRVEVLECAASMGVRQRLTAERRSRRGAHLPHPDLRLRSTGAVRWELDRPGVVRVDGRRVGTARTIDLRVRPDAAVLYA
jgi:hypothetical protein